LQVLADGLNALEASGADALWGEVHSIVGGIVPAVHWPTVTAPAVPRLGEPGFNLLTGPITTPNPRWAVAGLNRLTKKAGIVPALRLTSQSTPEAFVHLPTEKARVAWALWWCFYLGELKRLRRCDACGRWFRDATRPLNQRRCSAKCTKKINMRSYRANLRRLAAARAKRRK
jgi:hypothetical protein